MGSGVGLPLIPGAFAGIGTGLIETPGGMFAGSSFISLLTFVLLAAFGLAFPLEFTGELPVHPTDTTTVPKRLQIIPFRSFVIQT